jgi:branched-chain amino acid transport system permease protein
VSEQPAALAQEMAPEIGMPPPEVEAPPDDERIGGWTTEGIIWAIVGLVFLAWAIWCFRDNGTAFVALTGAGLAKGAVVALSALGFVMIIKATGIANFAQGDLITLGAFLGFWATDKTGIAKNGLEISLLLGYVVALALMFLIGLLIERVAYAPLKGRDIHVVVIATLGVAIIIRTLLAIWQGTEPRFLQSWFNTGQNLEDWGPFSNGTFSLSFDIGFLGIHVDDAVIAAQRIIIMVVTAIVVVLIMLLFAKTSFGRQVRAIAADRETARLYGVPATRLSMLSFGISAFLAGLAGLMIGPLGSFDLTVGFTYMLLGFAAVTLGGFTSIPGVVAGGVLIGLTEELFGGLMLPKLVDTLGGDPGDALKYRATLPFVLMLVVIAVRPQGLFGRIGGRL